MERLLYQFAAWAGCEVLKEPDGFHLVPVVPEKFRYIVWECACRSSQEDEHLIIGPCGQVILPTYRYQDETGRFSPRGVVSPCTAVASDRLTELFNRMDWLDK